MTIDELIQRLEEYRDDLGGDAQVRLMTQQNWPFENEIVGLASGEEINDQDDEEDEDVDDIWGGPDCGLGYGGFLSADDSHTFTAAVKGDYSKVEFHDGDRIVGEATAAPWEFNDVELEPGLRVLFAVGVKAAGARAASRPAFVIVK